MWLVVSHERMNGNGRFRAPFYLMEVQNGMFYRGLISGISENQASRYIDKEVGLYGLVGIVGVRLSNALASLRRWVLDKGSKLCDVHRAKDAVMHEHGPEPLSRRVSP